MKIFWIQKRLCTNLILPGPYAPFKVLHPPTFEPQELADTKKRFEQYLNSLRKDPSVHKSSLSINK
ncbi:MAG: hypothetical protein MHPSP_001167, partial [Paramarteilia canceri]